MCVCVCATSQVLPEAPPELVSELSRRYVYLYERITGQQFQVPDLSVDTHDRILRSLSEAGL